MPFTVSHVAAVLPAHRLLTRWRLLCAAVIGSMTPDFGLFLPLSLSREDTHSMAALLTFCLPVGLVVYWLTQLLIRPAIVEILPDRAYARLQGVPPPRRFGSPLSWLLVAAALIAGAITHLVWDGFTHEGARGVRMVPVLREYGPDVAGHALHLYRWLQHGSSIIGLVVVVGVIVVWWQHAPQPVPPPQRRLGAVERWSWIAVLVCVPALVCLLRLQQGLDAGQSLLASADLLENVVVAAMRAAAAIVLAVSLLLNIRL